MPWDANKPLIFNGSLEIKTLPRNKIKILGILEHKCLQYRMHAIKGNRRVTKRSVLSSIIQMYNPPAKTDRSYNYQRQNHTSITLAIKIKMG